MQKSCGILQFTKSEGFSRSLARSPLRQAQGSLEHTENAEKKVLVKVLGSPRNYRRAGGPDACASGQRAELDVQNKLAHYSPSSAARLASRRSLPYEHFRLSLDLMV